jgi:hypothetical protein
MKLDLVATIELVLERAIFIDCFFVCLDFVLIRYEMRLSGINLRGYLRRQNERQIGRVFYKRNQTRWWWVVEHLST